MTTPDCDKVKDLLPGWVAGGLDPVEHEAAEAHISACSECRAEAEVVRAVLDAEPPVPVGLEARIQSRVREKFSRKPAVFRPRWAPSWALSAAAMVILALGIGVIWDPTPPDVVQDPLVVASQDPLPEAWLWDDGMVAGAPVFDGLSDEDLEALLEELEG
jgi:predicted anti-sigma-YlaC factor YlaD